MKVRVTKFPGEWLLSYTVEVYDGGWWNTVTDPYYTFKWLAIRRAKKISKTGIIPRKSVVWESYEGR